MSVPVDSDHDCMGSKVVQHHITLKEYLLSVIDERSQKLESRVDFLEKQILAAKDAVKEAFLVANASLDKRFEAVNEFRQQLTDQQSTFARKSDVELAMIFVEKATVKAEVAVEKRFEGVNQFRAQLADQQATLVRKSEVDIKFDALEKKMDVAIAQLQIATGRKGGMDSVWGVLAIVMALILSGAGVVAILITKH